MKFRTYLDKLRYFYWLIKYDRISDLFYEWFSNGYSAGYEDGKSDSPRLHETKKEYFRRLALQKKKSMDKK